MQSVRDACWKRAGIHCIKERRLTRLLYNSNNPLHLHTPAPSASTYFSNMIFTHAIALAISALPLLAAATPLEARGSGSCSTGALQCCESTEKVCLGSAFVVVSVQSILITPCLQADSAAGSNLLKSLGVVVQDVNVLIGVTCSPITVVGVGSGGSCSAQTVCCDDNSHVCPLLPVEGISFDIFLSGWSCLCRVHPRHRLIVKLSLPSIRA